MPDETTDDLKQSNELYLNEEEADKLRDSLARMELDPVATVRTLGNPHANVTPEMFLDVTGKLMRLARGEEGDDNRDGLENQRFHTAPDLFAERILKDAGKVGRNLLWKATNKGGLDWMPTASMDGHVDGLFNESGLAQVVEETNPMDIHQRATRVTRMGEGGIGGERMAPMSARLVHNSYKGFIDAVQSPESLKIGLDNQFAVGVRKGSDGLMRTEMISPRSGKRVWVDSITAAESKVAMPGEYDPRAKTVAVLVGDDVEYVKPSEVDYVMPSGDEMFGLAANLIPLKSGVKAGRLLMAAKHIGSQSVSLTNRERPLVGTATPDGSSSYERVVGEKLGAARAKGKGRVTAVSKDKVRVRYEDGSSEEVELYDNFPFNRKSFWRTWPTVKPGQTVKKGDVLTASNYTDENGDAAMGTNLRIGYMSHHGENYKDAVVISDSAAEKLQSEHMYSASIPKDKNMTVDLAKYRAMFPGKFKDEQFKKLGPDGVARPGTVLEHGDPMIAGFLRNEPSVGTLGRRTHVDKAVTWKHPFPGIVTDVAEGKNGASVYVRADVVAREGDKLAGRMGNKGVISKILPDDKMPKLPDGRHLEILMNPAGIPSRVNPAQIHEALLGKVAEKTGSPYSLPGFMEEDLNDFVETELNRAGLKDREDVHDPISGKTVKGVTTGNSHVIKLTHTAESKGSGRATGGYTAEDLPATGGDDGAKRLGNLVLSSLVAHNAGEVLKDAKLIRGQRNDDFWRDFKLGRTPRMPGTPLVYEKFLDSLRGAGINVVDRGDRVDVFAMTNKEAADLTKNREVQNANTFDSKTFQPMAGGLFGRDVFGPDGSQWGHVKLSEPIPNPVMEKPLRLLLGLSGEEFEGVLKGEHKLPNGKTGPTGMLQTLAKTNLDDVLERAKHDIEKGSRSKRDEAMKRFRYAHAMKRHGARPEEFMLTRIPVIPPRFRPISTVDNMTMVSDSNYLYKSLLEARDDLDAAREAGLPDSELGEQRGLMYRKFKDLTGITSPDARKLVGKRVGGLLKWVFGKGSPKFGAFQRNVLGTTMDVAGRSVVTPNPSLRLDEVGMPEDQAWPVYSPFVIRNLVKKGVPALTAVKEVEEKRDRARGALVEEMGKRPLIVTRAPALHKFSVLAVKPKLIKGSTLQVSPTIAMPLNLDHDGNCVDFDEPVKLLLSKSMFEKNRGRLYGRDGTPYKEVAMLNEKSKVSTWNGRVPVEIKIGEFPTTGEPIKDSKGADVYEVPEGVWVPSYDPDVGGGKLSRVLRYTVDRDHPTVRVVHGNGMEIVVSDNESLCVFDREPGAINKKAPRDSVGLYSPVLRRAPHAYGKFGDSDLGWWVGMFVSDGWVSGDRMIGLAKTEKAKRDRFVRVTRESVCEKFALREYSRKRGEDKWGDSIKIHLNGMDLADTVRLWGLKPEAGEGRQALRKRIPTWMIDQGSREFLLGILAGLLDGDGRVTKNTSMRKPRFGCRLATSSRQLVEACESLSYRLGLRMNVTTTPPRNQSGEAYSVMWSTVDVHSILSELPVTGKREKKTLREWLNNPPSLATDRDPVPVSVEERAHFTEWGASASLRVLVSKKGAAGRRPLKKFLSQVEDDGVFDALRVRVFDDEVMWTPVKTVEDAGKRDVFDFEVAGHKIFATGRGLVVWDTASYYVPVSSDAVKEAYQKMLPSRNLLSARAFKAHFFPEEEYVLGGWLANRRKSGPPKAVFQTRQDAIAAYKRGEISLDDNVKVLE